MLQRFSYHLVITNHRSMFHAPRFPWQMHFAPQGRVSGFRSVRRARTGEM